MVNLFQNFGLKLICLMVFCASICTHKNNGSTMPPFAYKTNVFEAALKERKSPDIWKLPNLVPVYKKEEKRTDKKIYCPISLVPIFSKLFERVTYNSLFTHFASNKNFLHLLNLVFYQEIHALLNSCQ